MLIEKLIENNKHIVYAVVWALCFIALCSILAVITVPIAWLLDMNTGWLWFCVKATPIGAFVAWAVSLLAENIYELFDNEEE